MGMTGNGSTFALSGGTDPPASIGRIVSIEVGGMSIEDVEDDSLAEAVIKYLPGDTQSTDDVSITLAFDPDVQAPIMLGELGVIRTGTLTFPLPAGGTTPANLAGSGYLKTVGGGNLANNERSESEMVFKFDQNGTPLAFTAST